MNRSLDLASLGTLLHRHEVGLLVLFGSRARGTERADSDLDLGVLRSDDRAMSLGELGRLQSDLGCWSGHDTDVVDLARADALLRFEMVSDGRPLYEAEPGSWTGFVARTLIDHDDIAPFVAACVAGVGKAARGPGGP
jgi:predicted nucleotidyltransferase